jgi:short-subunit dehydrogenase involved in D-alanine esterification of teichoic acids
MPGIELSKCVFITGGTSGIGRALGYKIKDLPNKPQVIMAGRRQERLDELAKDGFQTVRMDLSIDRASLKKEAEQLLAKYPDASYGPYRSDAVD